MINKHIQIETSTWDYVIYELYDYDCQKCFRNNHISVMSNCSIIMNSSVTSFESSEEVPDKRNPNEIARISQNGLIQIEKSENSELWLVTKSLNHGYELEDNDIIKLGRLKFRSKILSSPKSYSQQYEPRENSIQGHCKICLSKDDSTSNPLISPCACTGSMGLIHSDCLSTWINTRIIKKKYFNKTVCYWKSIECEICKKQYNSYISFLNLSSHFNKDESILLLEIIDGFKSGNRYIWAAQIMDQDSVSIGRGFDSEIKINDISISRTHSIIENFKGSFILKDQKSKFGTLVKKEKYNVDLNMQFQVGGTLISFGLDENIEDLLV